MIACCDILLFFALSWLLYQVLRSVFIVLVAVIRTVFWRRLP